MKELRYNTGVSVTVGPFVSHFSGVTEITNLTLASCPEAGIIKKSSGVSVDIRTNEWEHMSGGHYDLRLTASNTDTTGQLRVYFSKSTACLQVWEDFAVVDQNFFDAKHSTGKLHTNPVEWSGVSVYSGGVSVINIGSGVTLSDKTGYSLGSDQSSVTIGLLQRMGSGATLAVTSGISNPPVNIGRIFSGVSQPSAVTWTVTSISGISNPPVNVLRLFSGVTIPDKTGYSLSSDQSSVTFGLLQRMGSGATLAVTSGISNPPVNIGRIFSGVSQPSAVTLTLTTNSDKTGYSISGTSTTLDDLNDINSSQVSTQLVTILKTDGIGEPSATTPAFSQTFVGILNHLYRRSRNKIQRSASTDYVYSEGGTTILFRATISDSGTTFTKNKYGIG